MVRRSAPALLGLFVCLLAAHLSSAAPAFRIDESRIRLSLDSAAARVRVEVENGTGHDFDARLRVELLDPRDRVRATASKDVRLRRGANALDVTLELPYAQLLDIERREFPWYRLRYSVAPTSTEAAAPTLEGVVSVSEVTPDLFELSVISAPAARPGSHYNARVRTANPVTGQPLKGVAIEATLTLEEAADKETALKASGTTNGDGFVTFDFDLPRTQYKFDDEAELEVTAQRGVVVEHASTAVSVEESPRVLLTTDKPLYQPGQTIHMRALVFDPSDRALAAEVVTFKVEDEDDSTAFTATLKTSRYGVASADWRVPESTKLGTYSLKLVMDDDKYDIDYGALTDFRISRYDLPNFSVTVKPDLPFYLKGQQPSVEVRADYLFGQPVKRGRVRVVRQTERRWNYKEQKYETEEGSAVEGELKQGRYVARLNLRKEYEKLAESSYQRFEDLGFVAYITDPTTNRTEQRRFAVRLTKDPIHVYVSEGRYRQAKGLPLAFYLATAYADGTPAECDVMVYEEGATERKLGSDGRVHEVKEADRSLFSVRTNRYGVAKVSGPTVQRDEDRRYLPLRFVALDRSNRAGHHEEEFWFDYYSNQPNEIRVETDKPLYGAGEPVKVALTSDAERLSIIVDAVSEGRSLYSRTVHLSGGRADLVIPTGPDFAGAIAITATSVARMPGASRDDSYSMGARTVVFPRDRELKLDVKLSQKSFRPGEEAGAQFAVRTADGRRTTGALGVVVFDKAVEERARTDGEAGRGFGFSGSFLDYWYGAWSIASVTRRDVERLDPARARPEGFDTVAEMLYNNERPNNLQRVTTGTNFEREQSRVYADLVKTQLKQLSDILHARYLNAAEYPSDEAALVRMLAQAGLEFAALRDPWGQPFRTRFSFERQNDQLDIMSSGADERPDTDDDFVAATFSRPYFRKTGEAIQRVAAEHHKRTGKYVRDLATLLAELRRDGMSEDALRDRWGQPYRFRFETRGTHHVIIVESAGPDRTFALRRGDYYADDFDIWVVLTDYFEESRKAVDAALDKYTREGRGFPRTREELTSALAKSELSLEALRDGWDRPTYATFSTISGYTDRVQLAASSADGVKRTVRPVTQTIRTVALLSVGADGREGTPDDFTLAYHTSIGAEQTAQDPALVPLAPVTTFSGGSGAITGTVMDSNGAVIPNTNVVAKHNFIEFEANATTNDEGVYLLRNLPSGLYTVTVAASGFMPFRVESVAVISSNLTKLDVILSPAAATETVTVTSDAGNQLNTASAEVTVTKGRGTVVSAPLSTPRLREFFPETLVWSPELETASDGTARLNFKLADNITTWKMSVIASTEDGRLGTVEQEFLSFQPFFVEHDPPRVLTEGDEISLPVVLRNYLPTRQGVDVEMKPENWFALGGAARRRAEVPAGDAARPTFDFRAVASVTDGKQRVTAIGADASDAIEKPVTVHPDGEERSVADGTLLTDSGALVADVPANVLRGSVRGELKVYPNLATHVLEGVEAIMARPYGCGEQTISSAYPSVLVLNYHAGLKSGGVEPSVIARARKYAQLGYERLLGYRATGGGFTYWGRGDADLALSAYALRFLLDASRVIEVDEDVIRETRDWLLKQQRPDGSWPAHTWGSRDEQLRTALTTVFIARVLAATQKVETVERGVGAQATPAQNSPAQAAGTKSQEALKRALAYAVARAAEAEEPYLIASLALAAADLGEPALVERFATRLRTLALEEGTGVYWTLETNSPFYGWGLAGRVETTALAIQALNRYCGMTNADCGSNNKLIDRALDFLLRKKDGYGVWYSTQATINVFDALLSTIAARGGAVAQAEDVAEVFVNGRSAGQLTLPPSDRLTGPLLLDVSPFLAAGSNRVELRRRPSAPPAQAHLVTTFYVPWGKRAGSSAAGDGGPQGGKASALKLSVGYDHTQAEISQEVTCNVTAERIGHMGYGMLLAEVGLPPGADVDRASLERAVSESGWALNRYDVLPDRLVVYLWPQSGGTRFQFKFRPRYGLNALTAPSQLYDYYNPEARTVVPPTRFVVR